MKEKIKYAYQKKSGISCRIEGNDEIILYNPDINDFIMINSSALEIWEFLETPHTADEICSHIMESYDERPERDVVLQDIQTILDDFGEQYICKV